LDVARKVGVGAPDSKGLLISRKTCFLFSPVNRRNGKGGESPDSSFSASTELSVSNNLQLKARARMVCKLVTGKMRKKRANMALFNLFSKKTQRRRDRSPS
jgi:hypothetical protein